MTNFVDLSMWNTGFPTGIRWLYLKASEGSNWRDPTFVARRAEAWGKHIDVGAYHFADLGDPVAECNWFLNTIGVPAPGRLRPALDLERGQSVHWAEAFISHFQSARGYKPAVYGSTSFILPMRAASLMIRECPWWRAEYGPNDGLAHPLAGGAQGAAAHQYTSVGHVPGVSGNVDCNLLLSPSAIMVPYPPTKHLTPLTVGAWKRARWWLGIGEYKGHGHYAYEHHVPGSAPPLETKSVILSSWRAVAWYIKHGVWKPK